MTRTEFWKKKIQINIDNDNRNVKMLMKNGWQVITIWECQLRPEICTTTLANLALCLVDKQVLDGLSQALANCIFGQKITMSNLHR